MTIPADAGLPYGPLYARQLGFGAQTGQDPYALADYFCWSKSATAACAGCANAVPVSAEGSPSVALPDAANVNPGDRLSIVACQSSPPVNGPATYAPSAVTTVQF
jgi:protein involved in polysaccharide export with SLBB domain